MAGKTKMWVGLKVGPWTLLERLGNSPRGHIMWRCRCDCGEEMEKTTSDINKTARYVGCRKCSGIRNQGTLTFVGDRFGDLTVLEMRRTGVKNNANRWITKCSNCLCKHSWIISELMLWKRDQRPGCASCQIITQESGLSFDYREPLGMKVQHLYLHGLRANW